MDLRHLLLTLVLVCANDSLSASDGKFYDTFLCLSVYTYIYMYIASYKEYFLLYLSGLCKSLDGSNLGT